MITKNSLTGNSGYSATLTGVQLNTSDLEKQDLYKNGALLPTAMYSLDIVGSDTIITFVEALTIFDKIDIYQYASLTLSQLKRQLKIFHDSEDVALREILEDAITFVEDYTQIAMWPRTITQTIDFENDTERLSYGPVTSVTSVTFVTTVTHLLVLSQLSQLSQKHVTYPIKSDCDSDNCDNCDSVIPPH